MTTSVLLKGGQVVSGHEIRPADVLIEDGVVSTVEAEIATQEGTPVRDASGRLLLPGLVDPHAHVGLTLGAWAMVDGFEGVTRAAAKGGVTTIVDFAQAERGASLTAAVEAKWAAAEGTCFIDFALHAVVNDTSATTLEEIPRLVRAGVAGFKVFMAYRAAGMMLEDHEIVRLCDVLAAEGGVLAAHAENEGICVAATAAELEAGNTDALAHARSRPSHAEVEAVRRIVYWTERARVPLYVVHVSTAKALSEITEARARGSSVYAETCPHYLAFDDRALGSESGVKLLMTPPLRGPADREALWRGLRQGSVHTVGSDEASWRLQDKQEAPNFAAAPNGIPGVESRLPILWTLGVETGLLTPCDIVRVCAEQPARLMGLASRKGSIEPGKDADIVVLDPGRSATLGRFFRGSGLDWSPYEGMIVRGAPEQVYARGRLVVDDGNIVDKPGGHFVPRVNDPALIEGPLFQ
jgi:dihydropyrimidinase